MGIQGKDEECQQTYGHDAGNDKRWLIPKNDRDGWCSDARRGRGLLDLVSGDDDSDGRWRIKKKNDGNGGAIEKPQEASSLSTSWTVTNWNQRRGGPDGSKIKSLSAPNKNQSQNTQQTPPKAQKKKSAKTEDLLPTSPSWWL